MKKESLSPRTRTPSFAREESSFPSPQPAPQSPASRNTLVPTPRRTTMTPALVCSVTVGVRLRPLLPIERGQRQCIAIKGQMVSIIPEIVGEEAKSGGLEFFFDAAMDSSDPSSEAFVSQQKCYELMGTGKTTTLMGLAEPVTEQGILYRLLYDLFGAVSEKESLGFETMMKAQMLEVYNEQVRDLLIQNTKTEKGSSAFSSNAEKTDQPEKVHVHVHPKLGVYLKGAQETVVQTFKECVSVIDFGNSNKTIFATAMNPQSSRGHTVFKLQIEIKSSGGAISMSECYFVDLAGRENTTTTLVTGDRLVELGFINSSLTFLASCIRNIGKKRDTATKASAQAQFRNSKLTLLLSNALTGNCRTCMVGTLSPAVRNFNETYSTLKFASTVKSIRLEVKAATKVDKQVIIDALEDEIRKLKGELAKAQSGASMAGIRDRISVVESKVDEYKEDWGERVKQAADQALKRGEGLLTTTIRRIIGDERADDPAQVGAAQQYYQMLRTINDKSAKPLHSFLRSAQLARSMVDQANTITRDMKQGSNLRFELIGSAPVLAFGFSDLDASTFPEISVRITRKLSPGRTRWIWAVEQILSRSISGAVFGVRSLATTGLISRGELNSGRSEVVASWSWTMFDSRLHLMQSLYTSWKEDPDFTIDASRDPWTPDGPADLVSSPLAAEEINRLSSLTILKTKRKEKMIKSVQTMGSPLGRRSMNMKSGNVLAGGPVAPSRSGVSTDALARQIMHAADHMAENGKLSVVELKAFLGTGTNEGRNYGDFMEWLFENRKEHLRQWDGNHDGVISLSELKGAVAAFYADGSVQRHASIRSVDRCTSIGTVSSTGSRGPSLCSPSSLEKEVRDLREQKLSLALENDRLKREVQATSKLIENPSLNGHAELLKQITEMRRREEHMSAENKLLKRAFDTCAVQSTANVHLLEALKKVRDC